MRLLRLNCCLEVYNTLLSRHFPMSMYIKNCIMNEPCKNMTYCHLLSILTNNTLELGLMAVIQHDPILPKPFSSKWCESNALFLAIHGTTMEGKSSLFDFFIYSLPIPSCPLSSTTSTTQDAVPSFAGSSKHHSYSPADHVPDSSSG